MITSRHAYINKPSSINENQDILAQVAYVIKDKYSNDEYEKLKSSQVIALQDGDLEVLVTTRFKPNDSNAYSVSKVLRGYLSIYKKYTGLDDKIKRIAEELAYFLEDLSLKYDIDDIQLSYVPGTNDLVIIEHINPRNGIMATRILSDICEFSDEYGITLAINKSSRDGSITNISYEFNEKFGFYKSDGELCQEEMLRKPLHMISEGITFNETNQAIMDVLANKESIQDIEYKKKWYKEYIKLIKSKEYKERRKKEYINVTIVKKRLTRQLIARVGFAYVGSATVV